jgi:hypothetical protein
VRDGDTVKHYRIRQLDEGGFFIARRGDILVHVWKVPWKGECKLLYSHWDILVHVWKVLAISNVFT